MKLTRVASMDAPIAMALRKGDANFYVAEKGGRVKAVRGGKVGATVLDISSQVSTGGEQGLLGLAFSPDGKRLYVNFTNGPGDTIVREYAFTSGRATSPRDVLEIDQPYANHNGGNIAFGPDGYLYIGMGDGGSAAIHRTTVRISNSLLGKMLRIDPVGSGAGDYSSPSSNPFVGRRTATTRSGRTAFATRGDSRSTAIRRRCGSATSVRGLGGSQRRVRRSDGGENYGWRRMEGTALATAGDRALEPPRADLRVLARRRQLLGHRRLRVPRIEDP